MRTVSQARDVSQDPPPPHNAQRNEKRDVERKENVRLRRPQTPQTKIGTVSRATLGKLLRDGVERMWAFLST